MLIFLKVQNRFVSKVAGPVSLFRNDTYWKPPMAMK